MEDKKRKKKKVETQKRKKGGSPGGSVAKNPLAKAGDTGSVSDPGSPTCRHRAIKHTCPNF